MLPRRLKVYAFDIGGERASDTRQEYFVMNPGMKYNAIIQVLLYKLRKKSDNSHVNRQSTFAIIAIIVMPLYFHSHTLH